MAELTCEPRWAFGAGVGNGKASVLSRASMVDEPSTLKIELIYWPATTFAARAEAQPALFRYIDGWQKPHPTRTRGAFARRIRGCMASQAASTRSATLQRKGAEKPR